jgi:hypothetical protein
MVAHASAQGAPWRPLLNKDWLNKDCKISISRPRLQTFGTSRKGTRHFTGLAFRSGRNSSARIKDNRLIVPNCAVHWPAAIQLQTGKRQRRAPPTDRAGCRFDRHGPPYRLLSMFQWFGGEFITLADELFKLVYAMSYSTLTNRRRVPDQPIRGWPGVALSNYWILPPSFGFRP